MTSKNKLWLLIFSAPILATIALFGYARQFDFPPASVTVYDRFGQIIGSVNPHYNGLQYWTSLDEIPQHLVTQTLQQEDRWFYWHGGVNPASLIKAAVDNLRHGRVMRGGSTITQQLAKLLMQEHEGKMPARTFANKLRETNLALGLEITHTKDWILERYLNTAYYGQHAYGIAAAAKTYFGKTLRQLNAAESTFLVALPKAPSRNARALNSDMSAFPQKERVHTARHFLDFAAAQAKGKPVLKTTLDLNLQKQLEASLPRMLHKHIEKDPLLTAAAVVIDVATGDILAMIGSRDYFDDTISGQVNAAVALRQPGSTLKPFTYFAAFAKGLLNDASPVSDQPSSFFDLKTEDPDTYIPQNFDRRYHGEVSVREALANSYNVPAVITLNSVGLSFYIELLRSFGIRQYNLPPNHYGLALTLGAGETTLVDVTNAYAGLARGGRYLPWRFRSDAKIPLPQAVLEHSADYARVITDILTDADARVKAFGYNEDLSVQDAHFAVKTGTSYNHRDNWTIGYNETFAVGVWVGHADGSPLEGTTGASGAGPYWHAIVETLIRNRPAQLTQSKIAKRPANQLLTPIATAKTADAIRIASPLPNSRYRLHPYVPIDHQKILAQILPKKPHIAADAQRYTWYLDNIPIAHNIPATDKVWIDPIPGRHQLAVADTDGRRQEVTFHILTD